MDEELRAWVRSARAIAVLSGAGMSAESGVPTFRDALTGLWARFDPQQLATEAAFRRQPQLVWDWYAERRAAIDNVQANAGHLAIADFQRRHPGRLTVITQNVDGLHQRAGSAGVLALHGNIAQDRWLDAPRACCQADAIAPGRPPHCPVCGNLRRPAVVWFGEMLPEAELAAAQAAAEACDLMLVVGTSGEVYPAAGLAAVAREAGARVLIVNPQASALDRVATHCLRATAASALPLLLGDD
ncbi:MAG: NAD-dependent protein deacylase [Hydrogenophaga sp.]|uniref:SIR2 family NAD-dependent protein deacylase n=1 Tax=Hydrogenophaga sp. TaxID=1904254 RepID=UPI001691C96E|nr:NAD-dependent deacylase [Hydrogenophaga sp.]NIM43539.1 NAD-dependent protein deacylase [Hydrogenophaga sp.]NIN28608.1 NAD-dependent protein deacylase [Hydrogenophaga sp.]NIN33067.1 NAD-dependent protein deacylase [Hydrogenophaga sp.]NIN57742.1 NAD-dependent protein deacylase [Hydrogenophaga sp.]NIO54037.1 NAD-dependent protein deacylase [Hydrogenophaga sp.]